MNHCITFDLRCLVASACVAVCAIPTQADNARQEFGAKERSPASLIGILYDLKQTQERSKTGMTVKLYSQVVDEFLAKKMDDSVLDKFYRVTQPLYTTQLYIPIMDAKEAPKAFSVEKTVSPAMWLIHYKGQAVPPETGRFRFIGYADDWLAVAVNGKIALVAARQDVKLIQTRWESPEKAGMRAGNGNLKVGDWIDFKKRHSL